MQRNNLITTVFLIFSLLASVNLFVRFPVLAQSEETSEDQMNEIEVNEEEKEDEIIIYVQEGCKHCKKVEKFVEKFNLNNIIIKDIIHPEYAEEYSKRLEELNLDIQHTGVPILIEGNIYKSGDDPIINYLGEKFNLKEEAQNYITDYGKSTKVVLGILLSGTAISLIVLFALNKLNK